MFNTFLENLFAQIAKIPFDYLIWFTFGTFGAIYLLCLALTLKNARFKRLSKRPFLCLANAYAAVTLGFFLIKHEIAQSLFMAVIFWIAAYILYGTLCLASAPRAKRRMYEMQPPVTAVLPQTPAQPPVAVRQRAPRADIPAARNSVRLEHAVSVTDRLLEKNLGKSDRQELEKLKNTLAVLQIKGTLSAGESEILNENFNTLLKLMAKYNM